MVYRKLHIHHYLFLYPNENYNAYSTPLRHEVWNVDHKMVMLGIALPAGSIFFVLCNSTGAIGSVVFNGVKRVVVDVA